MAQDTRESDDLERVRGRWKFLADGLKVEALVAYLENGGLRVAPTRRRGGSPYRRRWCPLSRSRTSVVTRSSRSRGCEARLGCTSYVKFPSSCCRRRRGRDQSPSQARSPHRNARTELVRPRLPQQQRPATSGGPSCSGGGGAGSCALWRSRQAGVQYRCDPVRLKNLLPQPAHTDSAISLHLDESARIGRIGLESGELFSGRGDAD
jgi:hypothetical protein